MKTQKTLYLTTLALLLALLILLGVTPLGMLNLGVVYVTILCVPVIIGTLVLGLQGGLIMSLCFGTISFITGLRAPSALAAPLLEKNILWIIALCYLPRLFIPVTTHFVYRGMRRKNEKLALVGSAFLGSLTNTLLYMGSMVLFYYLAGVDTAALLAVLASIIFGAGLAEAVVAAVITYPVILALKKSGLLSKLTKD